MSTRLHESSVTVKSIATRVGIAACPRLSSCFPSLRRGPNCARTNDHHLGKGGRGEEVATRTPTTLGAHLTRDDKRQRRHSFFFHSFERKDLLFRQISVGGGSQSSGSGKRSGDEEGSLSVHAVRALIPKGIAILSLSLFFFFLLPHIFLGQETKRR